MAKPSNKQSPQEFVQPSLLLQLTSRYLRGVVALIVAIILFAGYTFVLQKKVVQVQSAASENLPAKEKILSDLRAIKQELDAISLEFSSLREAKKTAINLLDELAPSEDRYLELFAMFEDITSRNGMTLSNINIAFNASEVTSERGGRATERTAAASSLAPALNTMTINITVQGGDYDGFKRYLDALERTIRIFDVRSVSFAGSSAAAFLGGAGPAPATSYDIELVSYYESNENVQ